MTETYSKIQSALDTRLSAYQSANVAWENVEFNPTVKVGYLRVHFLPAEPVQAALGSAGANRQTGIYQVSAVYPIGQGAGPAGAKADAIVSHFKRGVVLNKDDITVRIEKAWKGHAMNQEAWYVVPVTIRWIAYTPNT